MIGAGKIAPASLDFERALHSGFCIEAFSPSLLWLSFFWIVFLLLAI